MNKYRSQPSPYNGPKQPLPPSMSLLSITMLQNNLYHAIFFFMFLPRISLLCSCSYLNPNFEACEPATCGNQTITFPFYIQGRQRSFCGYPGFALSCSDYGLPILNVTYIRYIIHEISYTNKSIRVSEVATLLSNGSCVLPRTHNITLQGTSFGWARNQIDLFLVFGCNMELLPGDFGKYRVGCSAENETMSVLAMTEEGGDLSAATEKCNGVVVKWKVENNTNVNREVVRRGVVWNWKASECSLCEKSGGRCGFNTDPSVYSFRCYCPHADEALTCHPGAG